jgi:hypothetical protein
LNSQFYVYKLKNVASMHTVEMKKYVLIILTLLALSFETIAQIQIDQLGLDIDGSVAGDRLGWSVSLSSDGNRVALGAFTDNNDFRGYVSVYENIQGVWTVIGARIDGEAVVDQSGISVSISGDGKRVAIGATGNDGNGNNSGHVRVYEEMSGSWVLIGADLDGEAAGDLSGRAVSLSESGHRVAIGATGSDGNGNNSGQVRIYEELSGAWILVGADLDGESAGDLSGRAVSLSADGKRVAIGATGNDGNGSSAGNVRIYEDVAGVWSQLGLDIDGGSAGDQSGHAVSLSADGGRVAIGAIGNDSNGNNSGRVRVYEDTSGSWTLIGSDITGENTDDEMGRSVSLSADGMRVAVGGNGYANNTGLVRIYDIISSDWSQVGSDIMGESEGDESGWFVSLNGIGDIVVVGAPNNDGNALDSGQARVFELCNFVITCPDDLIFSGNDSGFFTIEDYTSFIMYDCASSSGIGFTQNPPIGTVVNDPSTTTVTVTATDAAGNVSVCMFDVLVDGTLSVDDTLFNNASISMYPNPTNGTLNIAAGNTTIDKVEVYDLAGRLVKRVSFDTNNYQFSFNDIDASVYLVQIYSGSNVVVKRVIKN